MKRLPAIILAAVLCGGLLTLHLWSLLRYPAPFVDEAWYAGRAWAFLTTGKPFGALDAGVFERFPGHEWVFEALPAAIQSLALRLAGSPELLPLRLVSLAFGILLLYAVFQIGLRLGGTSLAVLSTLLTASSEPFFYSAHLARYDIIESALGFLCLVLLLANVRRRIWLGALIGLMLAASFEMHPNAIVFGPVIIAVGLAEWGWSFLASADFWAFGAGTLFGLLGYFAVHILPNPATYFGLVRLIFGPAHTPPVVAGPAALLRGLLDELNLLLSVYLWGFFALVWAAVALAVSRNGKERVLSVLALVLVLGQALLIRDKTHYYAILVTPALSLLLAAFLIRCARWIQRGSSAARIAASLAAFAVLISVWVGLLVLRSDGYSNYRQVQDRVDADVRPADVIMSSQVWWFGLYQHPYYSWEQLAFFQLVYRGCGLSDALAHFRPDVFIIDSDMQWSIAEPKATDFYAGLLEMPGGKLDEILARQATLIDQFDGASYGLVSVYRMNWTSAPPTSASCSG